nr:hypothetical protein [uncultured Actinoplanes sp.]
MARRVHTEGIDALTTARRATFAPFVADWVRRCHATGPLSASGRAAIEEAVRTCYAAAGLAPPGTVVWVPSPQAGSVAAPLAAEHWASPARRRWAGDALIETGRKIHAACVVPVHTAVMSRVDTRQYLAAAAGLSPLDRLRTALYRPLTPVAGPRVAAAVRAATGARPPAGTTGPVRGFTGYEKSSDTPHVAWWLRHGGITAAGQAPFRAWIATWPVDWWAHPSFAMISEPPVEMHLERLPGGDVRLHRPDGPALRWLDGERAAFWHGVEVPLDLITEGWSVERIHAEHNSEVQRAAIERMGWPAYLDQAGLELVARCPDPGNPPHELALYADPRGRIGDSRILVMTNGSPGRGGAPVRYAEPVPARIGDPVEAAAWQYDIPADVYRTMARRT